MKLQHLFSMVLFVLCVLSCGKDDDPTPAPDENNEPEISDQTTSVSEGIAAGTSFYTVTANDDDGDDLTFSITTNDNDLFAISNAGALSVANGQGLDAANGPHGITVSVSDQTDSDSATITINVTEGSTANLAPVMEDQAFSVDEDIADDFTIATIIATDEDSENLTFSMHTNSEDLFEITADGALSLAEGAELEAWQNDSHMIIVSVSDGENSEDDATITINVNDTRSFITTWKTDTAGETINFGNLQGISYECNIKWGDEDDGSYETYVATTPPSHVYEEEGTYTIKIRYGFPRLFMDDNPSATKLMSIEQWGAIQWQNFENAFTGCSNMEYNATDAPDLSQVTSLWAMFDGCSSFNGDLSNWDVSSITTMGLMFNAATSFDGDISSWDVGEVTDMEGMFRLASSFNGNLGSWKVGMVTDMYSMFQGATSFNRNIGQWDVSKVEFFDYMFRDASSFNINLSNWEIMNAESMESMLDNSNLSFGNYDSALNAWANNANTPDDITLGANGIHYCDDEGRTALEAKGWTIDDAGQADSCIP